MNWFWQILREFDQEQRKQVLHFTCALYNPPLAGFAKLVPDRFRICVVNRAPEALPTAHTCFNILELPASYTTKSLLKERLLTALEHGDFYGDV